MKAHLLIAHGSRSPRANSEFRALAAAFADLVKTEVETCYLEMAQPDIAAGFSALYRKGFREIVAVPCFLFSGRHIESDLPEILAKIALTYDDAFIYISDPLGPDIRLAEILRDRSANPTRVFP